VATNTGNSDNPLILAIETSGRLGSVALAQDDKLLAESRFSGPMRHSAEIFPAITDLLSRFNKKPDQIEQVYISVGPGSFTGLRIAVTLAKTLALANDAKIVAIDTLDVIAANVIDFAPPSPLPQLNTQNSTLKTDDRLAVILDAKRGQFFIAVYEKTSHEPRATSDTIWQKILPDSLMTAEEFLDRFTDKPIMLIGEGLVFYKDKFAHKNIRVLDEKYWNPSAANIHKLGWELAMNGQSAEGETSPTGGFADPLTLIPNYIRGPDVTIKQI
jgi:tRNA threonylcarbamoyladenosine biosynthesis protein TsaB